MPPRPRDDAGPSDGRGASGTPPGPEVRRLLALVRPYAAPLALATVIVSIQAAITLVAPRVAGAVVDTAMLENSLGSLDTVVLVLFGLFALRGLLTYAQHYLLRATGARLLRGLRDRLLSHLVTLSPDFYETRRTGELLSRLGSDLTRVQSTLTDSIPQGIRASLTFAGTLIALLLLHVELAVVALAVLTPIPVIAYLYGRRLQRLSTRVQDSLADTSAIAEETLAGIRTVQAADQQERETNRYRAGLSALLGLQLRTAGMLGRFAGLLEFVAYGAFAVVLWYGGRLIIATELSPGQLTAFLLYMFAIGASIGSLGSLYAGLREVRGASARVFEILDTPPTICDAPGAVALERPRGRITLRDVGYRYPSAPDDRWSLRHIDLDIAPGEVVALVGPSGAGKSTLLSLLLRFADPTEGTIELDGRDLRALTVASTRRAIALVPQEIFLFSGTVADNIRYAVPGAEHDEVVRAAEAAGVDRFVRELPRGYDEVVGERGVRLSAGQRQRVALARAFLEHPAILLLDEVTSALDAESEQIVQQALERLMGGRTTLIIAHRLATARRADRIIVLENGGIRAVGTHQELHTRDPLYRRYWELQRLPGVADPPPDAKAAH
jgi:ATP-binding cassette, subfamily B, bacterial MsbA